MVKIDNTVKKLFAVLREIIIKIKYVFPCPQCYNKTKGHSSLLNTEAALLPQWWFANSPPLVIHIEPPLVLTEWKVK